MKYTVMKEKEFNIHEVLDVIDESVDDIIYSGRKHLHVKLMQFWSFLTSNPITKQTLGTLATDNQDFVNQVNKYFEGDKHPLEKNNILFELEKSIVNGGVFGYCFIGVMNTIRDKSQPEIDEIFSWANHRDYDDAFDSFETMVLNPFVRVLKWYLEDRETENSDEYFSITELEKLNNAIDELKDKIDSNYDYLNLGQDIIYDELEEIKEIAKRQKKKYVINLLIGSIISYVTSSEKFHLLMNTVKDFISSIGGKSSQIIEKI